MVWSRCESHTRAYGLVDNYRIQHAVLTTADGCGYTCRYGKSKSRTGGAAGFTATPSQNTLWILADPIAVVTLPSNIPVGSRPLLIGGDSTQRISRRTD